jgi:hypothetical protein
MGAIYSTHETNKNCIQNLKRRYTLGELDADREIILKINKEAVYKKSFKWLGKNSIAVTEYGCWVRLH